MHTLVIDGAVELVAIILSGLLLVLKPTVAFTPNGTIPTNPLVFI